MKHQHVSSAQGSRTYAKFLAFSDTSRLGRSQSLPVGASLESSDCVQKYKAFQRRSSEQHSGSDSDNSNKENKGGADDDFSATL